MLLGMVMTLLFMPLNVFSANFALPESTAFPSLSFPFGELPDTIPLGEHEGLCDKLRVASVAGILAKSIRNIHDGSSVSALFG